MSNIYTTSTDGSSLIYTGDGVISQISNYYKTDYTDAINNYFTLGKDKDTAIKSLEWLLEQLENQIKVIKDNNWENEDTILQLMDKLNKLSLEI